MGEDYISRNRSTCDSGPMLLFNLNRHRAWQIVSDSARRAKLPDVVNPETGRVRGVSSHRLICVHAMKLDDSGDALRVLQEHLGHASFDTTARYRKIGAHEHQQWYERLWSAPVNPRDAKTKITKAKRRRIAKTRSPAQLSFL